ncbi:MAG: metallophosphoesterase [Anaerolineae bacterium]|nr:metallophosphoesterase [Anaerolineae bacterium]
MQEPLVTFLHISDTHIHSNPNHTRDFAQYPPNWGAQALVETINNLPFTVDFVLHTGDVVYDPVPEMYATARDILSQIKYPVHYVAGNHDAAGALQNTLIQKGDVGLQVNYTFEVNGVQFAVVDSNGAATPPAGHFTESQLAWISEVCSADDPRPLVIATHHNVLQSGIPWLDDYMSVKNWDEFHRAILPAKKRIRGVFFGHVHQHIDMVRDGILYASTVSSWVQFWSYPKLNKTTADRGMEPGYSLVMITADQTFIRRCRFPIPQPPVDDDVTHAAR